jgi:hypothetical protein
MLRAIKPSSTIQALRLINKQRATLATSTRQVRGTHPSLIEADHDFTQVQNFASMFNNTLYSKRNQN